MGLTGPSRTIISDPVETPAVMPERSEPAPEREPAPTPERSPEREPVPA